MYRIVFTERALRDWKNLDRKIQIRIASKLKQFAQDPYKYAKKLIDPRIGTYRFRIGDYRIIFDLVENDLVILRVGHRREIYRS